jgi:hypothetical protein
LAGAGELFLAERLRADSVESALGVRDGPSPGSGNPVRGRRVCRSCRCGHRLEGTDDVGGWGGRGQLAGIDKLRVGERFVGNGDGRRPCNGRHRCRIGVEEHITVDVRKDQRHRVELAQAYQRIVDARGVANNHQLDPVAHGSLGVGHHDDPSARLGEAVGKPDGVVLVGGAQDEAGAPVVVRELELTPRGHGVVDLRASWGLHDLRKEPARTHDCRERWHSDDHGDLVPEVLTPHQ